MYLAIPVNERDGGTVYNTLLYFGPDGALLGKHRKLVATGGERLAWGMGDGSTLPVFDTPFGRLGGLICWENYMPLARVAMYEQGVDILLAPTWDNSDVWVASMRHIAKEGRCYVLGITSCLRGSDVPADIPGRDEIYGGDDDWMSRGNTVIVDPYGDILAGPISETEGSSTPRSTSRRCASHAGSSTSSATTRAPTCSLLGAPRLKSARESSSSGESEPGAGSVGSTQRQVHRRTDDPRAASSSARPRRASSSATSARCRRTSRAGRRCAARGARRIRP